MKRLISKTACELSVLLKNREISSRELTEAFLDQINHRDREIGAYLTLCAGTALEQAEKVDHRRAQEENLPPLAGIPMALKDNICTEGIKTTCASKLLSDFIPPYSATVCERLYQNGAVLLGKTNMDEFGMGSSTENSAFHLTRNPHDLSRVPGGSSGGSAAAVASDEAVYALGTDTGGSVRQPAAFCGIVGLRPTYGRISRYGIFGYANSMDQVGILSKDIRDNALVLQAIAGKDTKDATSAWSDVPPYASLCEESLHGLRIGVSADLLAAHSTDEVGQAVLLAARRYEKMGAQLVEVPFTPNDFSLQAYMILTAAEPSSNLARYDGVRYGTRAAEYNDMDDLYRQTRGLGFGSEVKRRLLLGTYILSEKQYPVYYQKALQVRQEIKKSFTVSFTHCDVILTPTSQDTAYRFGKNYNDPVMLERTDRYTVSASLAGLPALSVPCGKSKDGLPIGMQLLSPAFGEELLYRVAYAYEQEYGYATV